MTYSIRDLCERYGCGEHTPLHWIKSGQLKAIDVSRNRGGKPRWRITEESLRAFEESRTPSPPAPRTRRRKKQETGEVIPFYP